MTSLDTFYETMAAAYERESGFKPEDGGDAAIRLRVLAGQLFALSARADWLETQLFAGTATGERLDAHARMHGLTRKAAATAAGTLVFSRETPAEADMEIPENTACALTGGAGQYVTTQAGVLRAGETSVELPARAAASGRDGNAAAHTVTVMVNAPQGIAAVTNPLPFTGGGDAERDESLRGRLIRACADLANGANSAYYREKALRYPQVISAAVLPRARGAGTVDVAILTHDADNGALLEEIAADLRANRELAGDLLVRSAVRTALSVSVTVTAAQGAQKDALQTRCEQTIRDHFDSLPIGAPLLLARLGCRLLALDGVENYAFRAPQSDVLPDEDACLRPGALTVEVI